MAKRPDSWQTLHSAAVRAMPWPFMAAHVERGGRDKAEGGTTAVPTGAAKQVPPHGNYGGNISGEQKLD